MTKIKSNFFNSIHKEDDDHSADITTDEVDTSEDKVKDKLPGDLEEINEDDAKKIGDKIEYGDDDTSDTDSSDDTKGEAGQSDEVADTEFFTTIINDGADKGLFYYDPEKEYEGDGEEIFWEVQKDTLDKRYQEEYVDTIPEDYKSILTHLKLGKPLEDWVEAVKPYNYDSIKLDDTDNQKQLIEDHLALTGMDEEDIKDTIKEYEDSGTLEKNAKKSLKYLKANESKKAKVYEEQLEQEEAEAIKQQELALKEFKSDVLSTEELEGGYKLDKKTREKLFDHITKPVNKKTGESQLVLNQKSKERQLLFAYLDMIDFKFSDLEKKAETKVASGLRAKLSNATDINATKKGGLGRVNTESTKIPKGMWDVNREVEE